MRVIFNLSYHSSVAYSCNQPKSDPYLQSGSSQFKYYPEVQQVIIAQNINHHLAQQYISGMSNMVLPKPPLLEQCISAERIK